MTKIVVLAMCVFLSGCSSLSRSGKLAPEHNFCKNDTATVQITSAKGVNVPEDFTKRIEDLIKQTIDLKKNTAECVKSTSRNFAVEGIIIKVSDNTKHAFSGTAGFGSLKIVGDFKVKLDDNIVADFSVNKEHFWSMTKEDNDNMFIHEFEPFFADEVADTLIKRKI